MINATRETEPKLGSGLDDQLVQRLLEQRIVMLGQPVDDAIANRLCAQLLLLSAEDPKADISLYINSPGGSVSAGLAVYDVMKLIPNDVSTLAMGLAASMGQFLLSAGTPIDDGVANVIIAQLIHLDSENSEQEIGFYINSPGGSLTALMGIYDTMQYISSDISTVCIGQAASSAAVLLAAGTKGKRSVLPHSRVLLHQPSGSAEGTLPDLAVQAKEVVRLRAQMNEVLSRHTGQSIDKIKTDTDRDLIMTPDEAIGYGVVDRVMQPREVASNAYAI